MTNILRVIVAACAIVGSGELLAAGTGPGSYPGGPPIPHAPAEAPLSIEQQAANRYWEAGAAAANYRAQYAAKVGAARAPITINATRSINAAALGAIARGAARWLGPIGLGIQVADSIWDATQHNFFGVNGDGDHYPTDPNRTDPILGGARAYCYGGDGCTTFQTSPEAVCAAVGKTFRTGGDGYLNHGALSVAQYNGTVAQSTAGYCDPFSTTVYARAYCPAGSSVAQSSPYGCIWSACATGYYRLQDGTCSNAPGAVLTDSELAAKIASGLDTAQKMADLAQKLGDGTQGYTDPAAGPAIDAALGPVTSTVSPTSVAEAPQTTTTTDPVTGTTTTTTTHTNNITSNQWNVYNQYTTVTTTTNNGNTTTTTTTTGTGAGTGTDPVNSPQPQIECGSLSCESTQQVVKTETQGIHADTTAIKTEIQAAAAPTLPDQTAALTAAKAADKALSDAAVGQITADMATDRTRWTAFSWTTPGGSCTAPSASLSRGVTVSFDYCPWVGNVQAILGWLFALFGGWHVYGTLFRRGD